MKVRRQQPKLRRVGFTLIEVLLVMGILVALAAIAIPNLVGTQENAKLKNAKIQVQAFEDACNLYNVQFGGFPMALSALSTAPNPTPSNWKPLLKDANVVDPWGNAYNYVYPGTKNTVGPDVWSNGPDSQSGTQDDIGNWSGSNG